MIAFYLPGGVPVYLFSVLLGLGATLGLMWVGLQSKGSEAIQGVNTGLVALLGGLLAGRAAYVGAHWSYFQSHPSEILQIFLGGLAWPGALAGGVLAVVIYTILTGQPTMRLLDALLPLSCLLAISAWLACWLDGCAYGAPSQAWWALPARNEWGVITRRVPVQLTGALLTLGTLWLADRSRRRLRVAGQVGLLALAALVVQLFSLSFLRADSAPSWQGLHLESWAALFLALVFLLWLLLVTVRERLRHPEMEALRENR